MSRVAEALDPRTFGDLEIETESPAEPAPLSRREAGQVTNNEKHQQDVKAKNYWQRCLELVDLIGEYNHKKKNYDNAADPQKQHAINQALVNPYYNGEIEALKRHRDKLKNAVWKEIYEFNYWAAKENLDVEPIDGDVLLELTESSNDRAKFRRHLKKLYDQAAPPYTLTELPNREFRKPGAKTKS